MTAIMPYLEAAVQAGSSDIFILAGQPLSFKINGAIVKQGEALLMPPRTEALLREIYSLAGREMQVFLSQGDDDFSFSIAGLSRFRVSAYRQRGSWAAVIRVVAFEIPSPEAMAIPPQVMRLAEKNVGLVLVTGPAGGGKSTTQACISHAINQRRNGHIVTLEDPIEFLHRNVKSIVSQREIGQDTESSLTGLRACLRQAPDVILLGEMRDYETIKTAMTAAETGHLVISTLHTVGTVNTIDRIIDVFPPNQQQQVRVQLAMTLASVVSQQLLPQNGGGQIPAFEIMHVTPGIRNMIREGKTYQIDNMIQTCQAQGMIPMDGYIFSLYERGRISGETALKYAMAPDQMERRLYPQGQGKPCL